MRELREPNAVPVVQNGRIRIGVKRFTRTHDDVQILDNAKHVMFSTRLWDVPESGALSLTVTIEATGNGCLEGDLYDGFASFLCLDFSTGTAIDVFCRDDICAAVFARLPFPGITVPDMDPMKYWGIFDERKLAGAGPHEYTIRIDRGAREITWHVDGDLLRRQGMPDYDLGPLMLGLGLMTEKDIGPTGSVSAHGQGLKAEWSPISISRQ
jgi:hypothetical protein